MKKVIKNRTAPNEFCPIRTIVVIKLLLDPPSQYFVFVLCFQILNQNGWIIELIVIELNLLKSN